MRKIEIVADVLQTLLFIVRFKAIFFHRRFSRRYTNGGSQSLKDSYWLPELNSFATKILVNCYSGNQ